jgi:hypothetical protein
MGGSGPLWVIFDQSIIFALAVHVRLKADNHSCRQSVSPLPPKNQLSI